MKKLTKKVKKLSTNKFKTILAQPLPVYWPEIKDDDKEELQVILSETFKDEETSKSIKKKSVVIGLSSTLRAIQNDKASSVFFSADIKPKFVVNQAINLILTKHNSTKALIVPLLEDLTEKQFDVKTIAFAISKNSLLHIDSWVANKAKLYPVPPILEQYYNARNEMPKVGNSEIVESPSPSNELITKTSIKSPELDNTLKASKKSEAKEGSTNQWGDFISFSGKTKDIGTVMDVDLEIDKALLIDKIKKFTTKSKENDSKKEIKQSEIVQGKVKKLKKREVENFIENSDKSKESNYISLKMTKIQKNPGKIKRKKFKKEKIKM